MSLRRIASSKVIAPSRIIASNRISLQRMTVPPLIIDYGPIIQGIQYLVVAGGGGGYDGSGESTYSRGGGGGGGGCKSGVANTVNGAVLQVTVGGGGSGAARGSNSSITSNNPALWTNISTYGGGAGGFFGFPGIIAYGSLRPALVGGSGGGGYAQPQWFGVAATGAAGTPGEGFSGGNGSAFPSGDNNASGGGGGAGGAGGDGGFPTMIGGSGGAGITNSITGANVIYAAGGAGSGSGGQGTASPTGASVNTPGAANFGGGAGGCDGNIVGPVALVGGSGVVIIKSGTKASNTTGSPIESPLGPNWVYKFNSTGTITFTV